MTRMMTGSILKYRAKPEQTPAMILSSALLVKRLAIIKLPSNERQILSNETNNSHFILP